MPRKRQAVKLRAARLRWQDVGLSEMLDFFHGWRPPVGEFDRSRSAWETWEEYLADWELVRPEALSDWEAKHQEHLAQAGATVAKRAQAIEEADSEVWRALAEQLHDEDLERLTELEAEQAPFAERVYRRVRNGLPPDEERPL